MKLDFSKPVKTRSGRPVRIIETDRLNTGFPVMGYIDRGSPVGETLNVWQANGKFDADPEAHPDDLVQEHPEMKVKAYVVLRPHRVFDGGVVWQGCDSVSEADRVLRRYPGAKAFRLVPVSL